MSIPCVRFINAILCSHREHPALVFFTTYMYHLYIQQYIYIIYRVWADSSIWRFPLEHSDLVANHKTDHPSSQTNAYVYYRNVNSNGHSAVGELHNLAFELQRCKQGCQESALSPLTWQTATWPWNALTDTKLLGFTAEHSALYTPLTAHV